MPDKSESKKRMAPVYKLSEAMNVEIIVLDEPNSGGRSSRRFGLDSYHSQKNRGFGDFATKYMDCKVTRLSMPENSMPEDVRSRILEAVQCKSPDDLIILFYDGAAFDKGTGLYWEDGILVCVRYNRGLIAFAGSSRTIQKDGSGPTRSCRDWSTRERMS